MIQVENFLLLTIPHPPAVSQLVVRGAYNCFGLAWLIGSSGSMTGVIQS